METTWRSPALRFERDTVRQARRFVRGRPRRVALASVFAGCETRPQPVRAVRAGTGQPMKPRSRAMWTASVRELACSLLKIAET